MSVLRIGILGAARIAHGFVEGVRGSALVEVVAVGSRRLERAEELAGAYGIPRRHGSYDELLRDPEVDAIYNALPNGLHAEWSIAAARAGKHVLCEKPLAASEAEGRAMFDAAEASGVALLEAFPFHFQPQTLDAIELIAQGAIGEVRSVQAAFGFTLGDPANVRFDPALAGGALLDVGCYPVSLARLVFGRRPVRVSAIAHWTERGVDRMLAGMLEYPGFRVAQISCSFDTAAHRQAIIAGSTGVIETEYLNSTDRVEAPRLRLKRGPGWSEVYEERPVPRLNGFRLEAEAFARMVKGDRGELERRRAASLDNLATLTALLQSARTGTPCAVAPVSR